MSTSFTSKKLTRSKESKDHYDDDKRRTEDGKRIIDEFVAWISRTWELSTKSMNKLWISFCRRIDISPADYGRTMSTWNEKLIIKFLIRVSFSEIGWPEQVTALKFITDSKVTPFTVNQRLAFEILANPLKKPLPLTKDVAGTLYGCWMAVENYRKLREENKLDKIELTEVLISGIVDKFIPTEGIAVVTDSDVPTYTFLKVDDATIILVEIVSSMEENTGTAEDSRIQFADPYKSQFPRRGEGNRRIGSFMNLISHVIPRIKNQLWNNADETIDETGNRIPRPSFKKYESLFHDIISPVPEYISGPHFQLAGFEVDIYQAVTKIATRPAPAS